MTAKPSPKQVRCITEGCGKLLGEHTPRCFVVDYKGKRTELRGNGHVRVNCPACKIVYIVFLDNGELAMIL